MKKKRISKRMLYIILCIVIISIATLTIAYAALNSTLNISGSTEVTGSTWNITINKFNLQERYPNSIWTTGQTGIVASHNENSLLLGNAKLISSGTISGTTITGLQISFTTPGDAMYIVYEATNSGTIPAKLESFTKNQITISSSTNNASDVQLVSENFDYQDGYLNKAEFTTPDGLPNNNVPDFDIGSIICPGETVYIVLSVEFSSKLTTVPSSDVTISNIGGTLNFVQADKSTCIES